MGKVASLLYSGQRAICPSCAGLMTGDVLQKRCIDCGAIWKCVGEGINENELQYEEVTREVVQSA